MYLVHANSLHFARGICVFHLNYLIAQHGCVQSRCAGILAIHVYAIALKNDTTTRTHASNSHQKHRLQETFTAYIAFITCAGYVLTLERC